MADTNRIVVGVDGSAGSHRALEWALEERAFDTAFALWFTPTLEHASGSNPFGEPHRRQTEEDARQVLADAAAVAGRSGARFQTKAVVGHPAEALLREAADADLLVVGSHGRGAVATVVLGSVSTTCATTRRCPVTIIPRGDPCADRQSESP